MERFRINGDVDCVYYVSSKCRTWKPAKSLLVFAPDAIAGSEHQLDAFAEAAGWLNAAEEDGAVLILPLAPQGWAAENPGIVKGLYKTVWRDTVSPDPRESLRNVWCWETLIFAIGYDEGASFVGNASAAHPNAFAQAVMINGVPGCYEDAAAFSDRWLLPDASPEWNHRNKDIPVPVWLLGNQDTTQAEHHFLHDIQITRGSFGPNPETTALLMEELATRVRWKNSPDGTPARLAPKKQMDLGGAYTRDQILHNGNFYDYYVRLPGGLRRAEALPVVISLHGHGEPAWMFAQKNGWPELQDEVNAFLFVVPDSPEHTWMVERDEGMLEKMLDKLAEDYGIDRTRVYLTGFSNGAMATCWYGTRHPRLYAALSPWNSPIVSFEQALLEEGWQMPMFSINGDLDHKMDIPRRSYPKLFESFIRLNGGIPHADDPQAPWHWKADEIWNSQNRYTIEAGFPQGRRLTTWVYHNAQGHPRFCFTSVKDMPHGAIHDEARAAWEFLRHFSRPDGSKTVVYE